MAEIGSPDFSTSVILTWKYRNNQCLAGSKDLQLKHAHTQMHT